MNPDVRVLIVHEDGYVRNCISFLTTQKAKLEGISATVVDSPETAYKRLKKHPYDAIVSGTRFDNDLDSWKDFRNNTKEYDIPFGLVACTSLKDLPQPAIMQTCKPKKLRAFIDDLIENYTPRDTTNYKNQLSHRTET